MQQLALSGSTLKKGMLKNASLYNVQAEIEEKWLYLNQTDTPGVREIASTYSRDETSGQIPYP